MKFEWKIPHDFYPRLAQALVTAGAAGLLYAGAYNSSAYTPAIQTLTAETEHISENKREKTPEEPKNTKEAKAAKGTEISKETKAAENTEISKEAKTAKDTEISKEAKAAKNTETSKEAKTAKDTESETQESANTSPGTEAASEIQAAEASEREDTSTEKESADYRIETEIPNSSLETADSEDDQKIYMVVEYAGAPLANLENPLSVLQDKVASLVQFQPNYLDLTEISLSWEHLEEELTALTESYSGDWSVYVKNLSNGDVININQHPMESASLIKLFIMGAVMEQIHSGELEQTEKIDSLLHEMITVSDNEAANELVRYLSKDHSHKDGLTYLNSFTERHGFNDTQQVNGLEDSSLRHNPSEINKTSARDCGELLAQIYDGTLVSHLSSRKMEDLLLAQEITYKIPSALPDEAVSASKTGEVSDAENDSAIIYSPGGDFILCIMSGKWDSGNQAITHIREITKMVYNHFNPSETGQSSVSE